MIRNAQSLEVSASSEILFLQLLLYALGIQLPATVRTEAATDRKLPGLTLDNLVQTLKLVAHQQNTKGKEMELLLITLAFSVVAVVAHLGETLSRRPASTALFNA